MIAEHDIAVAGEQLVILLGFRTTNKVDSQQVSSQMGTNEILESILTNLICIIARVARCGRFLEKVTLGEIGQEFQICTKLLAINNLWRWVVKD